MIESLTQFGVAGLMGALWLWERTHSRTRERQLSDAHRKLVETDGQLDVLIGLVKHNTRALLGFEHAQRRLCELLEDIRHGISREKA